MTKVNSAPKVTIQTRRAISFIKAEVRSQKSEVRSQKSEVRSQESLISRLITSHQFAIFNFQFSICNSLLLPFQFSAVSALFILAISTLRSLRSQPVSYPGDCFNQQRIPQLLPEPPDVHVQRSRVAEVIHPPNSIEQRR